MCLLGICSGQHGHERPGAGADAPAPAPELGVLSAAPVQPPAAPSMALFVPIGVMLGCVVLGALVLALWWTKRLQRDEDVRPADVERGVPRCSLESERGAPYLPKIPVIIMTPDDRSLSLGWELQHTPCDSPTAAKAASAGGSGSSAGGDEEEGKPGVAAAPAARAPDALQAAQLLAAAAQQSCRRRPPMVSILVQAPEAAPELRDELELAPPPASEQPAHGGESSQPGSPRASCTPVE